jgi:hypothetical protein
MPIDDKERMRRHALVQAHYAHENEHDLDGIMRTFAKEGVMHYNRMEFPSDETIRWAHGHIGMSRAEAGGFSGLAAVIDEEHYTDAETVVEGRLCGRHTGEFLGIAPTGREVEMPFVAFYRFDDEGLLTSERVVMNLGSLQAPEFATGD